MHNDLELFLAEIDLLKSQLELQIHCLDQNFQQLLDIEYCYQDNLIEHGSLTRPETTLLVRNGLISPAKPMNESLAVLNHYQAIQYIREHAAEQALISESLLKQLHSTLTRAIDREHAGVYRTQAAIVPGSGPAPAPEQITGLMHQSMQELRREGLFMHPVVFAAETHLLVQQLQPFNSANGRCARLAMNLILLGEGYPLTIFPGDNSNCQIYYQALDQAIAKNDKPAWLKQIAERVMSSTKALIAQLEKAETTLE